MSGLRNNFLLQFSILGFQKSGTSTLHDWLVRNSKVSMPAIKETHHFLFNEFDDNYPSNFANIDGCVAGEADPEYMYSELAINNIVDHNENIKFVIILRDPFDRAYSHYLMERRRSRIQNEFSEHMEVCFESFKNHDVISGSEDRCNVLVRSLYSQYVSYLLSKVEKDQVKFILYDDLFSVEKRSEIFKDVCDFLCLDIVGEVDLSGVSNVGGSVRSTSLQDILFNEKSLFRALVRPLVKALLRKRYRERIAARLEFWNLSGQDAPIKLSKSYSNLPISLNIVNLINRDIEKLSSLIGDERVLGWKR